MTMNNFPDECVCDGAGQCEAAGRFMSEGQFHQCQVNAKFRRKLLRLRPENYTPPAPDAIVEVIRQGKRTTMIVGKSKKRPTAIDRVELPCIYRGETPIEWAGCGCHVYDCELFDRCVPWRKPTTKPGIKICSECSDRKESAADPPVAFRPPMAAIAEASATIAVTYWQRPASLDRLLASIKKYLPGYAIETEDTGGNLSAGRNRLYSRISTKYVIVFEDDFVALPQTAKGLREAIEILEYDQSIAGVGGIAREQRRGDVRWGHNFVRVGKKISLKPSTGPAKKTPRGLKYLPCQLVLNFGVFRRDLYRSLRWDEDIPIGGEHKDFFFRASLAGYRFAFYSPLVISHRKDRPNIIYNQARRRRFHQVSERKLGVIYQHHE